MALSGLSLFLRHEGDVREQAAEDHARELLNATPFEEADPATPEATAEPAEEPVFAAASAAEAFEASEQPEESEEPEAEKASSDAVDFPLPDEGERYADESAAAAPETIELTPTPMPAEVTPSRQTPVPEAEMLPKFASLQKEIPDIAGWLQVCALYQIDLAVVKRDNTFYLNHDITGAENDSGAAFMDEYNVLSPRDDNIIIYAHNKANGTMFGSLFRLGYREFVSQNPVTVFSTLYEEEKYIPVAVYEATVGGENDFDFMVTNFATDAAKNAFIAASKQRSYLETKADCDARDALLTLATCIDGANGGRLVVLLRSLRAGETEDSVKAYYR